MWKSEKKAHHRIILDFSIKLYSVIKVIILLTCASNVRRENACYSVRNCSKREPLELMRPDGFDGLTQMAVQMS